ncbi:MAG: hypothetical protein VX871_10430 [Pseudomonadota bacterium]|nr:hypothetical protein [Pseudomonadota bacterium]
MLSSLEEACLGPAFDTLFRNLRALAAINFDFAVWFIASANRSTVDENGLVENFQAALLAAAFVVTVRAAIASRGAARTAAIGFAFVCFVFFFREVDFRAVTYPEWVAAVTSGKIRNRIFFGFGAMMLVYMWTRRAHLKPIMLNLLSRRCRPLQVAGWLIVSAAIIEEILYHTRINKFWEENIEILGYGLMLYAAGTGCWIPLRENRGKAAAARRKTPR